MGAALTWDPLEGGVWARSCSLSDSEAEEEQALIRAARKGDRVAFGRIVERYKGTVFGVTQRMLGGPDASDASQEIFLRAFQRLASFDLSQPLRPWLVALARHHCIDELRRRGRMPLAEGLERAGAVATSDPEESLDALEQSARLAAAVAALPVNQREALLLFHQEQLSYREIAAALEVPLGTVMTWIHRARRGLRDRLGAPE